MLRWSNHPWFISIAGGLIATLIVAVVGFVFSPFSSPFHLHKTRSARRQRQPHGALASSPLSRQSIVNWGGATWATRHVLAKPMPKVIDYYFMIVGVIVGSFVVAITFGIPVARWLLQ